MATNHTVNNHSTISPHSASPNQLFLGTFVHATSLDQLEYLHDAAVFVEGSTGRIVAVEKECDRARAVNEVFARLGWREAESQIWDITSSSSAAGRTEKGGSGVKFFFPGFVDTHIHASQYPNAGIFGKSTLLDWLNRYTFPLEASLGKDLARARRVYGRCVRKTLSHGTTTASYFATVDVAATNLLVDLCYGLGQRALVGRVCMDEPSMCPAWYRDESAEQSISRTKEVMAHIHDVDPQATLIRPVVTPRFAPSCTAPAMKGLADLAARHDLPVQTHISENPGECALVAELFPSESADGRGYAGVYDAFGLLTDRTILAHGVHLSEAEAALVAARGAKVSHCPCSNSALTSGAARVRWLLGKGVDVGLGTDVSGGYSPSVLEAARQASLVSRHVAMGQEGGPGAKLGVEEVLYLATRGGAKVVGLEGRVGGFEVGMEFDAQLVGLGGVDEEGRATTAAVDTEDGVEEEEEDGDVDVFGWESWEDLVAKWLFNGDDRNTKKVWVRGRLVHQRGKKGGVA